MCTCREKHQRGSAIDECREYCVVDRWRLTSCSEDVCIGLYSVERQLSGLLWVSLQLALKVTKTLATRRSQNIELLSLTMRMGVLAKGESRITGGMPPRANTPPSPFLSNARLNIGSMTPCLIIVVRTGSYSSLSPVVALNAWVRRGKASPISPLVTLSPSQNAELASPTWVFFAVSPANVTS